MTGAILLTRPKLIESLASSMRMMAPDLPISMKLRAGYTDNYVLHNFLPKIEQQGINAFFVHGRTSRQRYTKEANWDYLKSLKSTLQESMLIGSGDVYTWEDYTNRKNNYSVDNVLIGRAALVKPWIFTEIKNQQTWDISSSERFDLLKTFVKYGLENWGSDRLGVEMTRSFLCRYIPVGILEAVQPKINWRCPPCYGRNDLETLMLSSKVESWVTLSEMLLGKAPPNFVFTPKHKANASSSG